MSDYPMLISNKLHSFRNFVRQKNIATGTVPMTMQSYGVAANSMFACFTDLYTALPSCRVSEQFHLVFPWG